MTLVVLPMPAMDADAKPSLCGFQCAARSFINKCVSDLLQPRVRGQDLLRLQAAQWLRHKRNAQPLSSPQQLADNACL